MVKTLTISTFILYSAIKLIWDRKNKMVVRWHHKRVRTVTIPSDNRVE